MKYLLEFHKYVFLGFNLKHVLVVNGNTFMYICGSHLEKFDNLTNKKKNKRDSTRVRKASLEALISFAKNDYYIEPESKTTTFGAITTSIKRLFVAYDGYEALNYDGIYFGTNCGEVINIATGNPLSFPLVDYGASCPFEAFYDPYWSVVPPLRSWPSLMPAW